MSRVGVSRVKDMRDGRSRCYNEQSASEPNENERSGNRGGVSGSSHLLSRILLLLP